MEEKYKLYHGDCLEVMKEIPDKSIDMILCDLPYGITSKNKWDTIIPMNDYIIIKNKNIEKQDFYYMKFNEGLCKRDIDIMWNKNKIHGLWYFYNKIIKDNGAIVLFGQDKFTAKVMLSNVKMHRYNLIWNKVLCSGFLNANKMPLREHEDIMIFYKKLPTYNPQFTVGKPLHGMGRKFREIKNNNNNYGEFNSCNNPSANREGDTKKYPKSILTISRNASSKMSHPTEKPIPLLKWLIRTYTNENEIILDNCMGSGNTGIATIDLNRKFIGIELDKNYFDIAKERIEKAISK